MNHPIPQQMHAGAVAAFEQQDWQRAYALSVQLLAHMPRHASASHIAGTAALALDQLTPALTYSRQAMQLDPGRGDYAAQFAKALSIANMHGEAVRVANQTLCALVCDPPTLSVFGVVYTRANVHERAVRVFGRAAAQSPDSPVFHFNFAMSLIYAGAIDAAQEQLEACLLLDPHHWQAHFSLAGLRRQTGESNHVDRLLSLSQQTLGNASAQMYLHMALGREYEDLGDFAKALEHFSRGKSAVRSTQGGSIKRDEALFDAVMRAFPEQQAQPAGCPTDEPIFVMGMPRSGTTLVERIISSHPLVHSAGELQNFGLALKHASGVRTPLLLDAETIAHTRAIRWDQLGEHYVSSTRPMTDCKPRFIDKLPHNFLYVGFIANALPNAKIICLRRNPLDSCLSNFRELFMPGSEFHDYSLDLLDIGRYYVLFDRLMAHWRRVFPGRVLEMQYETLVDTQEASTRRMLMHCDLPWNEACLRFESNRAAVSTASSVQVRAPIHRSAIGRWKKYEAQLTALRDLLANAGIDCG